MGKAEFSAQVNRERRGDAMETKAVKHIVEETPRGASKIAGRIEMSEEVVATIAGIAAREIPGIHALGRSRLISFGDKPRRGVAAEVGQKEAALDIEVIIEHGCDIRRVADELRATVAEAVDKMAGRKVIEVNLDVVDVHLAEPEGGKPEPARRVR
jgi:uncharacterized alkaline shock family protein YloU